jgi:hypothetical protein
LNKELPLLSSLFPDSTALTKNSKIDSKVITSIDDDLTEKSKNEQECLTKKNIKAPGPGFEPGSRE